MEMTARGNSTKGEKPCTISDFFYGWMPATTQQRNWRARSDTKAASCGRHFPLARSRFCCLDSIIPRETMEKAISLFFQRSRPRTLSFAGASAADVTGLKPPLISSPSTPSYPLLAAWVSIQSNNVPMKYLFGQFVVMF